MKKLVLFPIAALAFTAACADHLPTASSADASFNRGPKATSGTTVSNVSGEVTVAGLFEVTIPGAGGLIEHDFGINEEGKPHGWCHAGGEWENPSGNRAASIPHAHCTRGGEDREVSWNFSALAQLVTNPSGNINLNFKDLVDYKVHYRSNQQDSQGSGLFTHNADGGVWELDLDQFTISGNAFVSCSSGLCLNAKATFTYQGVVYEAWATLSW